MPYELIIFTTPQNAQGVLQLDNGISLNSHPAIHESGRPGIGFSIPNGSPNGNGARLTLSAPEFITIQQRAILWLRTNDGYYPWIGSQQAAFAIDDFTLPVKTNPIPIPIPIPNLVHLEPIVIITAVFNSGQFDLTTHNGCGKFTEQCCKQLHEHHSISWGHIKKFGAQEQYNGHAVDAIMLLNSMLDCDRGIYDIIVNSQSPGEHSALNRVGEPDSLLWYYPA